MENTNKIIVIYYLSLILTKILNFIKENVRCSITVVYSYAGISKVMHWHGIHRIKFVKYKSIRYLCPLYFNQLFSIQLSFKKTQALFQALTCKYVDFISINPINKQETRHLCPSNLFVYVCICLRILGKITKVTQRVIFHRKILHSLQ